MQAPYGLKPRPGRNTCSLGQEETDAPERISLLYAGLDPDDPEAEPDAFTQAAADRLPTSIFTPAPMVEESDTRLT